MGGQEKAVAARRKTPPPLEGGGWGEGLGRSDPSPRPLPQGEGESLAILPGLLGPITRAFVTRPDW
jgi:hypothetical protein